MKTTPKPENKEPHILRLSNISIGLDTYDDIFSDFDPRPYSERTISDDFLYEVRKICREKEEHVNELWLLMPSENRDATAETVITKRLHAHFRESTNEFHRKLKVVKRKAILFLVIGLMLMLLASFIASLHSPHFYMNALFILFEPTGWFLVWIGLDDLFYSGRKSKADLDFYRKMSKSKVLFFPYPPEKKT